MKKLLLLPVLTFAAWSAYWVTGKNTLMGAIAEAQTDLRQDGIELSASDIKVKGYPLRYRAALSGVDMKSDTSHYSVEAVSLKASALKPTVWTLSADEPVRIQMRGSAGQAYDFILSGDEMRVEMGSSVTGKLKSVQATMRGLTAAATAGGLAPPITQIEAGSMSITPNAAPLQDGMSARFDLSGLTLGDKAGGDLQRAFGRNISRISGTAVAAGLASLDADDMNAWQKSGAVTVPDFAMNWGAVSFHGEVDLNMGPMGANGVAALGVSDADALVQSFVQAGMISQNQALGAAFLLMAAPQDAQGRTVLTFPVQNNALTLFGQTLHKF